MASREYKRSTVTSALLYANGPVHIGHLAGCYLPADIYVRYLRSTGHDVIFVSGTDEHGVPITLRARQEGITPQELVDKYYDLIKDSFQKLGISFDIFSRTSNQTHHEVSSDFFMKLYNDGVFTEKEEEQYFDQKAGQFLADRYITGTCPVCSNPSAYGDQCERCGSSLSPDELIDPKSTLSGDPPVKKSTKNWYLPLDQIQPEVESYIDSHKEWKTNVYGQCKSWLNQGLRPRAMTRDLDWGVKVPLENSEGKVLYVWFDAPIGYITFTQELASQKKFEWETYWKDNDSRLIHFIGKDNIVFHCIIFPAMLMKHGDYVLADNVPANEFMNLEGNKISTSRNWAVWLHEYLEDFPDKEDVLRYALCANMPETKDNDFTWKDFQAKNNNELVAILGNFINRAVVLTHKYFEGQVPPAVPTEADSLCLERVRKSVGQVGDSLEKFRFREALNAFIDIARIGNKYLADNEPWKLIKTDPDRVGSILNVSLQISACLATVCEPFLPFTSSRIEQILNFEKPDWKNNNSDTLKAGHVLNEPFLLFEKIEDEAIENQIEKLKGSLKEQGSQGDQGLPAEEIVSFDDFSRMVMKVGTIISAEDVPKSKKLLKLEVDIGSEKRTVVSGISEYFSAQEVVGHQVTVLTNLAPRKIMGIESQGMILMAEDQDGSLKFLKPSDLVANGSRIS